MFGSATEPGDEDMQNIRVHLLNEAAQRLLRIDEISGSSTSQQRQPSSLSAWPSAIDRGSTNDSINGMHV